MKVGDLVYDDHYGDGLVLGVLDNSLKVFFAEVNQACWMDKEMIGKSVEVVNENR